MLHALLGMQNGGDARQGPGPMPITNRDGLLPSAWYGVLDAGG